MSRATVVRPEEIRRHNLSQVLQQIHVHGEMSRAELTASLGLNRSTIGDLVADLVRRGMVDEHVPAGGDKAGRPSHVVAPRRDGPYVLAVEVEVERMVTAAVGLGGRVHVRRETPLASPLSPSGACTQIARDARWLAARMPGDARLVGVGVSVPGTVSRLDGLVVHAPNLGWRSVPFGATLRQRLGSDVRIGNNANLGAVAEHQRGAARQLRDVVYVTGSVGVGGGVIVDGAEILGAGGYAGEIGHIMLDPDGPACHCGSNGCLETFLGEHALLRAAGCAGSPGSGAVASVFSDARLGRQPAAGAVAQLAVVLGRALGILINVFNPEAIIVHDMLEEIVRLQRPAVEAEIARRSKPESRGTLRLLTPELGRDSALIGASELAFQAVVSGIE
ncbi:ROK family transcriptional regulator [Cryptosporangium phraense]|uniref:ROK family protein n=1 Tax=Cryptosporangium phraense TaxID=2593070 RepID=A0A545AFW0_9ACTN|nr:ROK family transcriptional regulator [Cryptosporangium phraense]TQS40218.1 ROK family protein [Cryptosporangium phraense]